MFKPADLKIVKNGHYCPPPMFYKNVLTLNILTNCEGLKWIRVNNTNKANIIILKTGIIIT